MKPEAWHKDLSAVSGELSLAIAKRRLNPNAVKRWIELLTSVTTSMQQLLDERARSDDGTKGEAQEPRDQV